MPTTTKLLVGWLTSTHYVAEAPILDGENLYLPSLFIQLYQQNPPMRVQFNPIFLLLKMAPSG